MLKLPKKILLLATLGALLTGSSATAAPSRLPGKFVWFDLVTTDVAAASRFYGSVFGWTFQASPGPDKWTLIHHDGRDIGGLVAPPADRNVSGARWIPLISVSDAAATAGQAAKLGGKVEFPPAKLAWRGTHALLRDADGALIGLLQAKAGDAPDAPVADGDFFWADLLTPAPAKAAEFYRAVAGYEVSEQHLGEGIDRVVLSAGGQARAGIAPLPASVKQPGWLPYVLVSDVPATLAKVTAAGGRVLLAPRADLLDSQLAVIADPTGGVLGLVNWTNENAK